MKTGSRLFAVLCALGLWACGPAVDSEPAFSDTLGSTSAALNTCTNDCAAYGGQPISCQGQSCSSSGDFVVCDGQYTYCMDMGSCESPGVRCPDGSVLRCLGTSANACGLGSTNCSVQCDGIEYKCARMKAGWTCPVVD